MKKTILATLVCALLSVSAFADHVVQFTYDQAGNRTGRAIVLPAASSALRNVVPTDSTTAVFSDTFAEMALNVYPNPTHGQLKIELDGLPEGESFRFLILSSGGEQVMNVETTENPADADLSECPAGIYLLKLFYKETTKNFKIIRL